MRRIVQVVSWAGAISLVCLRCAMAQETYTFYPAQDTWLNEANPAAGYGSNSYLTVKDTSGGADALFKFGVADLAKLAGKRISSASLSAYQYLGTFTPGDWLTLYKVESGWDEASASWQEKPAYGGIPVSTLEAKDGVNTWRKWAGLEGLVSSWVSNPQANFGLALSNALDGQKEELYSRFYSSQASDLLKRPYLEVTTSAAPEPISSTLFMLGAGALVARRVKRQ